MSGLAEFVLARLAEHEAVARETPGVRAWECDPHPARPVIAQVVSSDGALASEVLTSDAQHIARWDPARVLAECEAKRRIITELAEMSPRDRAADPDATHALTFAVRCLALPDADHPDYRDEWSV